MDFITNRSIDASTLALDGLALRNKMLAANVANADTPGYKRVDVKFEDQLAKIIKEDRLKEYQRQSSMGLSYSPNSLDLALNNDFKANSSSGVINQVNETPVNFNPEVTTDDQVALKPDGNNVNIEFEMAELAKNGTKYTAVAQMQQNAFKNLGDIIRGGGM